MNVPLYEKIWMWAAGGMIAAFVAILLITSIGGALEPPSHVETIDPTQVFRDPRFAHPGVTVDEHGATVVAVGMMFAYVSAEIHVPAGKPVYVRSATANGRRRSRSSGKHARSHWYAPSGNRSHDSTTTAGLATLIPTRTTAGPPDSGHRTRTGTPSGGSHPTRGASVSPSDHTAAALTAVVAQSEPAP